MPAMLLARLILLGVHGTAGYRASQGDYMVPEGDSTVPESLVPKKDCAKYRDTWCTAHPLNVYQPGCETLWDKSWRYSDWKTCTTGLMGYHVCRKSYTCQPQTEGHDCCGALGKDERWTPEGDSTVPESLVPKKDCAKYRDTWCTAHPLNVYQPGCETLWDKSWRYSDWKTCKTGLTGYHVCRKSYTCQPQTEGHDCCGALGKDERWTPEGDHMVPESLVPKKDCAKYRDTWCTSHPLNTSQPGCETLWDKSWRYSDWKMCTTGLSGYHVCRKSYTCQPQTEGHDCCGALGKDERWSKWR